MKKILTSVLIVLATIIMLTGCTPTTVAQAEIGDLPWIAFRTFKSEKCSYAVTKYVGDGEQAVSTDGKMIYELKDISDPQSEFNSCYSLTMDFYLTYDNSEYVDEIYRGKTDSIHSEAIFRKDTLAAVYVKKTATITSDPTLSYSYEVDYVNADDKNKLTASFTDSRGDKQIKFKKAEYFDNDYLYYYVRALKNLSGSFKENIFIVNWYDSFNNDKLIQYPLIVSCSNRYENVKINDTLFNNFIGTEEKDEQEKLIKCYEVSIVINAIKTGSELQACYSTCEYDNADYSQSLDREINTKFIPLKYKTLETVSSGYTTFFTDYVLTEFSLVL